MMLNQDLAELLFDPLSDEELSELSEHFDDLHDSLESMNFSMIDGFFTALVLSPNAQLPEKWLEMILVDMDAFNKMPKRTDIVELLYRHYQQIKLSLSVMTPPEFEPIYLYHDAHEQPWVADWCYGFVQGVQADLDVWQNLTGVFPMLELITAISTLPPPNEAPLAWQEDFSEEDALF